MHVDASPGDRAASCRALMRPTGLIYERGEFIVIHECTGCGAQGRNRVAPLDDLTMLSG